MTALGHPPAQALADTHARAFPHARWSAQTFATWLDRPGTILSGSPHAFVLGHAVAGEAEILTLATHPDHRRRGLATAALAEFLARAGQLGADRVFLEVDAENPAARALYERAGFTAAGLRRNYYRRPDGTRGDAVILELARPDVSQRGPRPPNS